MLRFSCATSNLVGTGVDGRRNSPQIELRANASKTLLFGKRDRTNVFRSNVLIREIGS